MVVALVAATLVALVFVRTRRGAARLPGEDRHGADQTAATTVAERLTLAPPPEARVPAVEGLGARIRSIFGRETTAETWTRLEETLIRADVGPRAAAAVVARVRASYRPPADPPEVVAQEIAAAFAGDEPWKAPEGDPAVIMVVGVNGGGKTTTIGKLAHLLSREGRSVTVANSDTFRVAAAEQLETWARRAGAHLVAQARGADPGAVAFDSLQAARARGSDVLIVDTAGRLHTRQPLMEELNKVKRVLEKAGGRVDEVLLVLDATTGQNGIAQARAFTEAVEVTGIALAKMDGTARGGIVLAVREELGIPVKLMGVGERVEDLVPFDPQAFARRLVS